MTTKSPYFHHFEKEISEISKPSKFTFPFYYTPHPLSILASEQIQDYLKVQKEFQHNFGLNSSDKGLVIGKMFGVLVAEDINGNIGFLAGVSGKLAGTNKHHYFVPPIYDMLCPDGFFLKEEEKINQLNKDIERLQNSSELKIAIDDLENVKVEQNTILTELRKFHKINKAERKKIRQSKVNELTESDYRILEEDLIKQSYRDQHEYEIQKEHFRSKVLDFETNLDKIVSKIDQLKLERKQRSSILQNRLFNEYQFLNALNQRKSVLDIFTESKQIQPPAGAGDCAAPKLLQYAFENNLKPLCMAEFWWGASPGSEVRKHKNFYPACRGKCEPILNHMLKGILVDSNPMLANPAQNKDLEIIYEDEAIIVVDKPSEFLSVPGINIQDSVQTRILNKFPKIDSPLIIHRLDMSTSGILILAKTKSAHQFIQEQFINHTVEKRYTALLDGIIRQTDGLIDLPLRVDLDDRPRQVVCYKYGKPAQTKYKIISIEGNKTRIHYFPLTGRTHQLRVHSAHFAGLNTPIVGDDLYGTKADRLHLHAGFIKFIHPITRQKITFQIEDPF